MIEKRNFEAFYTKTASVNTLKCIYSKAVVNSYKNRLLPETNRKSSLSSCYI